MYPISSSSSITYYVLKIFKKCCFFKNHTNITSDPVVDFSVGLNSFIIEPYLSIKVTSDTFNILVIIEASLHQSSSQFMASMHVVEII